ncbi:MAG: lysozyme inhibitor LprI family protein [Flavobacterium nitrogenifigens]|uniref:lysozyme inhibitor LprI family protein n=1 Tax=Flavobacterium nitrogenifigens TaxID=1617283 RepID=UPI0028071676|nr:lysozyme inhibitor LprI family protein [Flavobacterium nitrogenifigens]MDQ8013059.1 lysozyme inhibitor LprI family protein [Flavobacterium nitrogenifigens]
MKKIFVLIFLLLSIVAFSQTKKENPIDVLESKCLNKDNISNADMCNCTIQARESWDKELNKYYNLLKTKLPKEAFETLKESQKQWLVYRDKEYSFISKYFYEVKQGTMWYAVAENKKKEIVKTRAIELERYYKMLEY